jgi:hypothetical protein
MSKVTITQSEHSVEIQVDTMTYLYDHDQYAELFHTALQHPPKDVVWTSCVTTDLIDPIYADDVIDELNDAVANTCMQYALVEENLEILLHEAELEEED